MRTALILTAAAMVGTLGGALNASQQRSQRQLAERFDTRGQLAASFASTWVTQLMDQESRAAVASLSGTTQLDTRFANVVEGFGFPVAGLMDTQGRALALNPRDPALIGTNMASRFRHIATAEDGHRAISSAVISASQGLPVVAFAVPYDTPSGRRVFSGAYQLDHTPLGAFLTSVTSVVGSRVYVIDATGTVVATSGGTARSEDRRLSRPLSAAQRRSAAGDYTDASDRGFHFNTQPVAGTPWSLVMTAPHDTLYAPISGPGHLLPWLVLGVVALLACGAGAMLLRIIRDRNQLRALNATLDRTARTDELTGLPNRRHLNESLATALSAGRRHHLPVSVLVMDLDHFKIINDTFGHSTGDHVLQHVAKILRQTARTEDLIGRWGGEEFLVVLPHTDDRGAAEIAQRIRHAVADLPFANRAGDRIVTTTISIGCATSALGGDTDDLIHRADQALYRAKSAGRNTVRNADTPTEAPAEQEAPTLVSSSDPNQPPQS